MRTRKRRRENDIATTREETRKDAKNMTDKKTMRCGRGLSYIVEPQKQLSVL